MGLACARITGKENQLGAKRSILMSMVSIKLLPEDIGVQNLKFANRLSAKIADVDSAGAILAEPAVHYREKGQNRTEPAPVTDRRSDERRRGRDRRKQPVDVLLDTRSTHDRRSFEDRRGGSRASTTDTPPPAHIDLYA